MKLVDIHRHLKKVVIKFIYSEKATNFCEISTLDLSNVVMIKSKVEVSQNFVAFSEYMNCKALKMCSDYLTYVFKSWWFQKNPNWFQWFFYNQKIKFQKTRAVVCVHRKWFFFWHILSDPKRRSSIRWDLFLLVPYSYQCNSVEEK